MACLGATVALCLILLGVLIPGQGDLKTLGVGLLAASGLGYTASRTYLKAKSIN